MTRAASLALILLAACSGGTKVGDDVDLNVQEQAERLALGEVTTTTAASSGADSAKVAISDAGVDNGTTTTTVPDFEISIHSDSAGDSQFDPSVARVAQHTRVRWVNRDSVPRSVVAGDGTFDSGMIPPGGSYAYVASVSGSFDYTDGTRPYAVGRLEVVTVG